MLMGRWVAELQDAEQPSVGEDQVVPTWGYEDLYPMARAMLDVLNEHRPGELAYLKDALHRFLPGGRDG